ncbi:hypothetical protein QTP88_010059 [Uroleucon formosanum]
MQFINRFISIITEATTVLDKLVKAKESIKRKYIALKTGSNNVQQLMKQSLKPIIEPLTEISNKFKLSLAEKNINIKSKSSLEHQQKIENWFQSIDLDKTYGPKKLPNGFTILGDKEVKFLEDTILIDGIIYPSTLGVTQLLFLKNPLIYTDNDLDIYKPILIHSSAHLSTDGKKIKKGGSKYTTIISKLFPSGGELFMKLQKNNLVYWDNPNELVNRLRLLLASKAAGMSKREIALEVHKPARKNFTRRRVNAYGKNDLWQADLVEMIPYSKKIKAYNILKASIIERFNRTLKEKMFWEFTARGSHAWFSILPKLLEEYNNSRHRTIGMTPVQADTNPESVKIKQREINNVKIKFKVGDNVLFSTIYSKTWLFSQKMAYRKDSDKKFQIIEEIDKGNCENKESDCSHSVTLENEEEYNSDIECAEINEFLNMINAKA